MKKKIVTLTLALMMGLSACGNKTEAPAASEDSVAAESSVTASSETESASKEQIILNDVIEDIKEAGKLHKGDETNRIISFEGEKEFTFSQNVIYTENGRYNNGERTFIDFDYFDGAKESEVIIDMWQDCCLTTPEGIYVSPGTELREGFAFIADSSEDGKHFYIVVSPDENADPKEAGDYFLQLVQDFLKSDNVKVHSMSNVTFNTETLRFSME